MEIAQVGLEGRVEPERLIDRQALADDGEDGAVLRRDLGDIVGGAMPPPPGMLIGMTEGRPGMCLPMCLPRSRE